MPLGLWCADLLRFYQPARCHCEEQSNRRQLHHGYQVRPFYYSRLDAAFSNDLHQLLELNQTIGSVIHFRPQLPNGVRFIILGQHVSLLSISYSIQNVGNQFTTLVIHRLFSIVSSIRSSPCRSTLSCYNNSHRRTVKLSEPSTSVFSRFGACAKDPPNL